jgi:hypothetical protein
MTVIDPEAEADLRDLSKAMFGSVAVILTSLADTAPDGGSRMRALRCLRALDIPGVPVLTTRGGPRMQTKQVPSPIEDVPADVLDDLRDRAFRAFWDACDAARPLASALAELHELDRELAAIANEEELGERYETLARVTLVDRLRDVLQAEEAWLVAAFGVVASTDLTPDDVTRFSRELNEAAS